MSSKERFDSQVRLAREEQVAPVDVTDAVMQRVQTELPSLESAADERRLILAASLSLVAAAAVLGLALPWMDEIYDPFVQMLQSSSGLSP